MDDRTIPRILALDLATKTGWAENVNDTSGMHNFYFSPEQAMGARVDAMYAFIDAKWQEFYFEGNKLDCVYYEQCHMRGGGATRSAMALISAVELWAYRRRIPIYTVHTGTLKKHATGSGRASKNEMVTAAMDMWPSAKILDDNHADALHLLDYAINHQAAMLKPQYEKTYHHGEPSDD